MYQLYFGKLLLPQAPDEITLTINGKNETFDLLSIGEVNKLKSPGLSEIEFPLILPSQNYPWARYENGVFQGIDYYLTALEILATKKQPFQFIVLRKHANRSLHTTNITVSLEDYALVDTVEEGTDTKVSVRLKQYKEYSAKKIVVKKTSTKKTSTAKKKATRRPIVTLVAIYTTKKNDTLWGIAKKTRGSGAKWLKIYNLNKSKLKKNKSKKLKKGIKLKLPD